MAIDLATGIRHICEHTRWSEKTVVIDLRPRVDGHVVLNLHAISDDHIAGDIDILPENAIRADSRARLDMAEMPDLRAIADYRAVINVCAFVLEVVHAMISFMEETTVSWSVSVRNGLIGSDNTSRLAFSASGKSPHL